MKMIKLKRCEKNPIMLPRGDSWESAHVSNAGAVVHDGKVHLIYRAEGQDKRTSAPNSWPITRLGHAVSENGFDISQRDELPVFDRSETDPWRCFGCEDPRISKIGDTYYIVFTAMSRFGHFGDSLMYSTTKDFVTYTEPQPLMREFEQRTSGFLPGKINGEFCLFHRPMPNMWLSYSKDLINWHDYQCIFRIKPGTWYDKKLGIGAPPILTRYGWLLFWHAKNTAAEYALGIMLLDKDDPAKIIKFQGEPVLRCEMPYEKEGFVNNAIYTCGAVEFNGQFIIYYGCCDQCLSVASVPADEVYQWCQER
ncbi:MAG: glycosidase [Lentisphaerae bacterium]|nr:glycosidase [Lentisphaerota bacterium]